MNLIGAPTYLGCDRSGPELSPDFLRTHGIISRLEKSGRAVYDLGNILPGPTSESGKFVDAPNMKYLNRVLDFDRNLAEAVFASLCSGALPLVVGGDHSVALGSISGSAAFHNRLGVIWIDAHGDINTDKTSPSGNIHGMCLAALMGFGDERLTSLYLDRRKVDPKDVFLLGVRSLDPGEVELIEREGINVYYMDGIRRNGIEATMKSLIGKIKERDLKNIHCSIDIDVIDPRFAPGTGTTVPEGMLPEELMYTLRETTETVDVVSWDIVELNPALDIDSKTTDLALGLAGFIAERG